AEGRAAEMLVRRPLLDVRVVSVIVTMRLARARSGRVLRGCVLFACESGAHRLVFPWVLSRLQCPWLVREVSDGKIFLRAPSPNSREKNSLAERLLARV